MPRKTNRLKNKRNRNLRKNRSRKQRGGQQIINIFGATAHPYLGNNYRVYNNQTWVYLGSNGKLSERAYPIVGMIGSDMYGPTSLNIQ